MALAGQTAKFAIEGFGEALAAEVRSFGIRVTLVEPGPYATDFFDHDGSAPLAIYNPLREQSAKLLTTDFVGDPTATWPAIEDVVDAEAPPLRLIRQIGKA